MRGKVFITGDSHTAALRRGLDRLAPKRWEGDGLEIEIVGLGTGARLIKQFFRDDGTRAVFVDPDYRQRVAALPRAGDDLDQVAYGWSGLFHFPKVWRDRTWGAFRPSFHAGPGMPVSTRLLRDVVLEWFAPQLELVSVLRRAGAHVFVVESPRPFRHHPALERIEPAMAIAIDGFCQSLMQAELERRGVGLVRIPAECKDDEGFMLPEWRSPREGDPHHGNTALGALMLRQVARYLEAHGDA